MNSREDEFLNTNDSNSRYYPQYSQNYNNPYPDLEPLPEILADEEEEEEYAQSTLEAAEEYFRVIAASIINAFITLIQWKHFFKVITFSVVGIIFYYYLGSNFLAILFSFIAVLCFIPMFYFRMLGTDFGFSAMMILASIQSFQVGFIVGKVPNIIGRILAFQLEPDMLYEFFIYIPIAFIASLFPLKELVPVGIILTFVYTIGYFVYHWYTELLTPVEAGYAITNCIFNIVILTQLVPILIRLGYG